MQVVSIATAATSLDVSKTTIRRLIASGRLPAYRVGRQVRINSDELAAVLRPVVNVDRDIRELTQDGEVRRPVTNGETGDAA